tara:strand:- start:436 stop:999 length:564 start_codon:yes stop_codon:yes gene_type:complete
MLDLHIIHTIRNATKYYRENESAFNALFPDIGASLRTKYFNAFQQDISFDKGYLTKIEKFPIITTSLVEVANDANQFLGNRGMKNNLVILINNECTINIYSDEYDYGKVVHRVIQAAMLAFKPDFLRIGYLNVEFVKSEEFEPDEDLISDGVKVYGRQLTYRAQQQLIVPPIAQPFELNWDLNPNLV